ncbi:MAG: hypothetical protein ACP5UD_09340, partial [Conexivisphaera sp.]
IERLYPDPEVTRAMYDLHALLLRKGASRDSMTGDGTGYSLTVKRNYYHESYAQELRDMPRSMMTAMAEDKA